MSMNPSVKPLPELPEHLTRAFDEDAPKDYSIHIPGCIARMPDLTLVEKAMLAMIDSLHRNGDGCFASNAWFADRLGLSMREISRLVEGLRAERYIEVEQFHHPTHPGGRVRFLTPTERVPFDNPETPRRRHDKRSNQSRQNVQTSCPDSPDTLSTPSRQPVQTVETICPEGIDKTARQSRHDPACLESNRDPVADPVVDPVVHQQQQSRAPAGTPAREVCKATAAAVLRTPDGDTGKNLEASRVRYESQREAAAEMWRAIQEDDATEKLLEAGFDNERDARRYARRVGEDQIDALIRQGKTMKLHNFAGWLRIQLDEELASAAHAGR
jgi:hypothetical protein